MDTSEEFENEVEEHHIFNPHVHWKKQVPIIGMRFENPKQLKSMLFNYAVKNGYQLWFEKNDDKRLLVLCCKVTYTFRIWSSWMSIKHSFQIKSLKSDHQCARNYQKPSSPTSWTTKNHHHK